MVLPTICINYLLKATRWNAHGHHAVTSTRKMDSFQSLIELLHGHSRLQLAMERVSGPDKISDFGSLRTPLQKATFLYGQGI